MDLIDYALEAAKRGWKVFPLYSAIDGKCTCGKSDCATIGKHPYIKDNLKLATSDKAQIRKWWQEWPQANIGIAAGASNLLIIDIDSSKGKDGEESFKELLDGHEEPETVQVLSGGGGRHLYFHPLRAYKYTNTSNINGYAGVDIRTEGGYVVGPGSIHETGNRYEFEINHDNVQIATLPAWIASKISVRHREKEPESEPKKEEKILEGERHETLLSIGTSMRKKGASKESILTALQEINSNDTDVPKPEKEIKEIVEWIDKRIQNEKHNIPEDEKPRVILLNLDEIKPEPIEWLWHNRIPLGKYSLLVGDPGNGKSTLAFFMASLITTGRGWPDIGGSIKKGTVIFLTTEDGYADTVRTRIDAMGGDVSKIKILDTVQLSKKVNREFTMPEHVPLLAEVVDEIPDLRLFVADPITGCLGTRDGNSNISIRSALIPILRLAEKKRFTFLGISHLNKDSAMKALYRSIGSVAFVAASRATFCIVKDENPESTERKFLPLKTNLSFPYPKGLAFNIISSGYETEEGTYIEAAKVEFPPGYIDETADELMGDEEAIEKAVTKKEGMNFLKEVLKKGPMPVSEVKKLVRENDICSDRTLARAKNALGIESFQKGNAWSWCLPGELK